MSPDCHTFPGCSYPPIASFPGLGPRNAAAEAGSRGLPAAAASPPRSGLRAQVSKRAGGRVRSPAGVSFACRARWARIAEPAAWAPRRGRSIRRSLGTDLPLWTETLHWGEVLIKTLKCICLIKHIRDNILKGQILFSKRMSFSASVFYWNNNPDKIRVAPELLGEADERKGIFALTTNTLYSAPIMRLHSTFIGSFDPPMTLPDPS